MISTTISPTHTVHRYDLAKDPRCSHQHERERKARKMYLDLAVKGDPGAILLLAAERREDGFNYSRHS